MKQKRWAIKLALCLLAGAVVTWAVAWGCALWSPFTDLASDSIEGAEAVQAVAGAAGYRLAPLIDDRPGSCVLLPLPEPHRSMSVESYRGFGVDLSRRWYSEGPDVDHCWVETRSGWPSHALAAREHFGDQPPQGPRLKGGWPAPRWTRPAIGMFDSIMPLPRVLPGRVLPLGFALDTLLYGGVVLGVVEGAGFARRRRRRAVGRCAVCGYDRRGLAAEVKCPECGAA